MTQPGKARRDTLPHPPPSHRRRSPYHFSWEPITPRRVPAARSGVRNRGNLGGDDTGKLRPMSTVTRAGVASEEKDKGKRSNECASGYPLLNAQWRISRREAAATVTRMGQPPSPIRAANHRRLAFRAWQTRRGRDFSGGVLPRATMQKRKGRSAWFG